MRYNFAADSFYIMSLFALDKLNIRHISTSGLVDLLDLRGLLIRTEGEGKGKGREYGRGGIRERTGQEEGRIGKGEWGEGKS